MDKNKMQKIK